MIIGSIWIHRACQKLDDPGRTCALIVVDAGSEWAMVRERNETHVRGIEISALEKLWERVWP